MASAKHCFVIMPFSTTGDKQQHTTEYWNDFFSNVIKPAVEKLGYTCTRSSADPGNIMKTIVNELVTSDVVLAVLTDYNPNVLYELGTRHSLKRGTIMMLERGQKIPSDIAQYGVIYYDNEITGGTKFQENLRNAIQKIESDGPDSPVQDFVTPIIQQRIPSLKYGRIIVRHLPPRNEHSGTYHDSLYLLEVINSTPNTVARNCDATLDLPNNTEIVGLWNKNDSPRISIGHPELLRLFSVLVFKSDEPDETTLRFFRLDIEGFLDTFKLPYLENLKNELRVLIQCESASYPSATDVFSKTIQFIMNNAVEDKILSEPDPG
jgi:hypothetical protein